MQCFASLLLGARYVRHACAAFCRLLPQVAQEVSVSWVASRVLTTAQITGLKDRLDGWISRVNAISTTLEQESIGVALEVV
jgi:26S proteasome regulatory subunit N9